MKYVSVKQIQRFDEIAINKYGVPSLALMENAGRSVAQEVLKRSKGQSYSQVTVVCGLGNNAGDGFVIARHLVNAGQHVNIFLVGKGSHLKADAAVNYLILKRLKYSIKESVRVNKTVIDTLKKSKVVVDAIFGVGLNRNINEPFRSFIEAINQYSRQTVSVDIPSGLDGTTGKIYGICIKASVTVTFSFAKAGFAKNQGLQVTGKIVVVDIGIPRKLMKNV